MKELRQEAAEEFEQDLNDPKLTPAQRQAILDSWDYREVILAHRHEVVSFGQFFAHYNEKETTPFKVPTSANSSIALMWREEGVRPVAYTIKSGAGACRGGGLIFWHFSMPFPWDI